MWAYIRKHKKLYCGSALIISMIFLAIFSSMAVGMFTMSSKNIQMTDNHHKANIAQGSALSGLEVMGYWLSQVSMPGTVATSARFDYIINFVQTDLASNSISNISTTYDSSVLSIANVDLDGSGDNYFSATIQSIDPNRMRMQITGSSGTITRTITVDYRYDRRDTSAFDYGIATKGPLYLKGKVDLDLNGPNVAITSGVHIESDDDTVLTIIGNSQIADNVNVTNSDGEVILQGNNASIGGETGQDAIDNHVTLGADATDFPYPDTSYFEQYVQNVIDSGTDTSTDITFENVRIAAGTNPTFSGDVTLEGIVFIETPNVVTFTGNASVVGIIVGDGDVNDDSETNQIEFTGNVTSLPVSALPDEAQFSGIKNETGTFIMAPGFSVSMGGNFTTTNGGIAANGISFSGNAGGTISGSIINYSDNIMSITGSTDLTFERSSETEIPAGFIPELILHYDSASYSEIVM